MSQSLSNVLSSPRLRRSALAIGLPLWVFLGFVLAQAVVLAIVYVGRLAGIPFSAANDTVLNSVLGAVIYTLTVAIVIAVPWLVKKRPTTMKELGLERGPGWLDLLWTPAGYIVYAVLSGLLLWLAMHTLPFVDFDQVQDTGFHGITQRFEFLLAFVSLVVVAPIAEEVLFRGYLLSKLRKRAPLWIAILVTSLTFAIVHFAWNVGFDVFVLSVVLCVLRVITGSLWAPIMLHMLKNAIAFYFLFVDPSFIGTLGG